MKKITVEWFRCCKEGQTCSRRENNSRVIHKIMAIMKPALMNMKIDLEMKEVMLADDRLNLSNTVMINGRSVEEILGEEEPEKTSCPLCSGPAGKDAYCRTFVFRGSIVDSLCEEMLQEAILAEIGPLRLSGQDTTATACTCK